MNPEATSPIRVRFCPSPTGTPHVGMVRTCLFNWAYARHTGGTFVFRIEDTDAKRDSEESFQQILESLRWLGLDWDEGVDKGGPYGPYRQSERMDIYKEVADKLLAGGYAYESYSTPEEIAARHKAAGRNPHLGYDGYDRNLTEEQIAAFRAEGRQPVLRMRMPDEDITFHDLVRGDITFQAGSVPDYVIVRGGGDPLYTLVNPVDDALMHITHVLRGEDLLSSTPRQIVLYRALIELGIADCVPEFAHLPYVMGEGNKKLSKRDPESNLLLHRENGMIPEGLVNYLALLGWALSADRDVFSKEELIAAFDIEDVNPNPARFDSKKALAINADHIRMLETSDFTERIVPYLHAGEFLSADNLADLTEKEKQLLEAAAPLAQSRMQVLSQAKSLLGFLFIADDQVEYQEKPLRKLKDNAPQVLAAAAEVVADLPEGKVGQAGTIGDPEAVKAAMSQVMVEEMGLKPRVAFQPLFMAVTGSNVSIPVFDSIGILGKEATIKRLHKLQNHLEQA